MIYVRHSDGSMTPARRGTGPLLGLRYGDEYVAIGDTEPWSPPKFKVGDRIRLRWKPEHTGLVRAVEDHLYTIDWPDYPGARYGHTPIDRDYILAPSTLEEVLRDFFHGLHVDAYVLADVIRKAFPKAGL